MKRKIILHLIFLLGSLLACKKADNQKYSTPTEHQKIITNNGIKSVEHKYSSDSLTNRLSKLNNDKCKIDNINGFYIPKSLKDSHLVLDTFLHDSTKMYIKNGSESHFGLGMYLRNNWGLWSGSRLKCYFEYQGIGHPDHMTGMIIETYSMKLNNKRINEDSLIKETIFALEKWKKEMGK
jgi:hypothetical protein